jgi:hypothetical protein
MPGSERGTRKAASRRVQRLMPSRIGRYELLDERRTLVSIMFLGVNLNIVLQEAMRFLKLAPRQSNDSIAPSFLSPFQFLKRASYRDIRFDKEIKQRLECLVFLLIGDSINDNSVTAAHHSSYGALKPIEELGAADEHNF